MISKSEPLSQFVQKYEETGLSLGVFQTYDGKHYAIRAFLPEDPDTGLQFVMAFSSGIKEAERPTSKAAREKATLALNAMLHDSTKSAAYSVCTCVVDSDSLAQFPDKYSPDDLGKTFIICAKAREVASDYNYAAAKKEKAVGSVTAD